MFFFFFKKKKKSEKLGLKEKRFSFWSNWPADFSVYFSQYSSIGEVTNKEDFLFVYCSTPEEAVGLNSNLTIMC